MTKASSPRLRREWRPTALTMEATRSLRGAQGRVDLDQQIPYLLNSAGGRYAMALAQALRQEGMRYTSWRVLHTLWVRGPLALTEIAQLANFDLSTLSRVVDGLEDQGLVMRLAAPGRGVRRRIELTTSGGDAVAELLPVGQRYEEQLLAGLSPVDRATLTALLQRLRNSMLQPWPESIP